MGDNSTAMGSYCDEEFFMTNAEALETLDAFVGQHAVCGEQAISTEFREDKDTGKISVTKRCQKCEARAVAPVTKAAATALLRQTAQRGTRTTIEELTPEENEGPSSRVPARSRCAVLTQRHAS
jgi:hypothetical protein